MEEERSREDVGAARRLLLYPGWPLFGTSLVSELEIEERGQSSASAMRECDGGGD